jgi:hypothetical protein
MAVSSGAMENGDARKCDIAAAVAVMMLPYLSKSM